MKKCYPILLFLILLAGCDAKNQSSQKAGEMAIYIIASVILVAVIGAAIFVARTILNPPKIWGHLVKVSGNEPASEFPLRAEKIAVGRVQQGMASVAFFQDDHSISRLQGMIVKKGSRAYFENRSTNGTVVNGQNVSGSTSVELLPGTTIEMGTNRAVVRYRPLGYTDEVPSPNVSKPGGNVIMEKTVIVSINPPVPVEMDRTVHTNEHTVQNADRTMIVSDRTVVNSEINSDLTVIASERPAPDTDNTVHVSDNTVHVADKPAPDQDKTVHASPPQS